MWSKKEQYFKESQNVCVISNGAAFRPPKKKHTLAFVEKAFSYWAYII